MKVILSLIVGLFVAACGHYPVKVEPFQELTMKEGKARLYVYFDCDDSPRAGPVLYINNVKRAYLAANTYYASYVETESLEVSVDVSYYTGKVFGRDDISINPNLFQNENEIYIKYFTKYDEEKTSYSVSVVNLHLMQVPNEIGRGEISKCHRATKSYYSKDLAN